VAATFTWAQSNGAGNTVQLLGSSGNLTDFKSIDTAGISDYVANPVTAGTNSYECWLRALFTGTFNQIRDLRFWMSTGFSPSTGLAVFWSGIQNLYLQPANGTSSIATSSVPIADPGTANVSIGGNLSGSLVASGYSDFIVLQLRTTAAAAAGDTSLATMSISYSEQ
jgi:hypothetical protein